MWCLLDDGWVCRCVCFFFQAEDGIRDLVRSRGLGDVYKRQDRPGQGRGRGLSVRPPRLQGDATGEGLSRCQATHLSLIHI